MSALLFKLVLRLLRWGEARFGTKAEQIITAMTTEPMLTLIPDPLLAAVAPRTEAISTLAAYKVAALVAADGSKTAIKDRDQHRVHIEAILKGWMPIVEQTGLKANDITILEKSGFDLRQPIINPNGNGVPAAPIIVVKRGQVSRSVGIRVKPVLKGVGSYEVQYTLGDPTVEANFNHSRTFKNGSRITFSELELAKLHNFRVRGVGSTGPGDWSDPAGIIVT